MGLGLAFRLNIGSAAAAILLALLGPILGIERANALIHENPLTFAAWAVFYAFFLSLLWLWFQSWVMLIRAWKRRTVVENTKLFLLLFIFNFFAAYYFYWKRYDIDSSAE